MTPVDSGAAGDWIASAIDGGPGPLVKEQVPIGYEAYLRILHPVRDGSGNSVSWADVACALKREPHRQMQWHSIVGAPNPTSMARSEWAGSRPVLGELPYESLEALCPILERYTPNNANCFFAFSTIHAEIDPSFTSEPLLELPNRDFVLLSGPLSLILQDGDDIPVAPSLMWPTDRTWFLASEFDFDSTLVGGTIDLIRDINESPRLDTWIVFPDDSLAEGADNVNR